MDSWLFNIPIIAGVVTTVSALVTLAYNAARWRLHLSSGAQPAVVIHRLATPDADDREVLKFDQAKTRIAGTFEHTVQEYADAYDGQLGKSTFIYSPYGARQYHASNEGAKRSQFIFMSALTAFMVVIGVAFALFLTLALEGDKQWVGFIIGLGPTLVGAAIPGFVAWLEHKSAKREAAALRAIDRYIAFLELNQIRVGLTFTQSRLMFNNVARKPAPVVAGDAS